MLTLFVRLDQDLVKLLSNGHRLSFVTNFLLLLAGISISKVCEDGTWGIRQQL